MVWFQMNNPSVIRMSTRQMTRYRLLVHQPFSDTPLKFMRTAIKVIE